MYIEILNETIIKTLDKEAGRKNSIEIKLTPILYKALHIEINKYIKFNNEVPIASFVIHSVFIYDRTIKLVSSNELDNTFEECLVKYLAEINTDGNRGIV